MLRNKNLLYLVLISFIVLGNSCADKKDQLVTIETNFGNMKVILYDDTPKHKENFIALARAGRYDSTIFHRVIKNFMIQGGNIDAKEETVGNNETIPAEFVSKYHHVKGALAAARQPDQANPEKSSSWCQFYIVHGDKFTEEQLTIDQRRFGESFRQCMNMESNAALKEEVMEVYNSGDMKAYEAKVYSLLPEIERQLNISLRKEYNPERLADYSTTGGAPHLDDEYTVFGMVIDGLEVVDSIAAQKTQPVDKPVKEIYMKVSVEDVSKKKITKEYGYQYPEE